MADEPLRLKILADRSSPPRELTEAEAKAFPSTILDRFRRAIIHDEATRRGQYAEYRRRTSGACQGQGGGGKSIEAIERDEASRLELIAVTARSAEASIRLTQALDANTAELRRLNDRRDAEDGPSFPNNDPDDQN